MPARGVSELGRPRFSQIENQFDLKVKQEKSIGATTIPTTPHDRRPSRHTVSINGDSVIVTGSRNPNKFEPFMNT